MNRWRGLRLKLMKSIPLSNNAMIKLRLFKRKMQGKIRIIKNQSRKKSSGLKMLLPKFYLTSQMLVNLILMINKMTKTRNPLK